MKTIPSEFTKTALLVIDVQQELFAKKNPIYRAGALLANINRLAESARRAGVPVVYIQHNSNAYLVKDSDGWQLHPGLQPGESDLLIYKQHPSSFEKTTLQAELDQRQVGRLVITGLVTHGCVKATCEAAIKLGYQVTLVADAHSNFHEQPEEKIAEWNEKLSRQGAQLLSAADIRF